MNKSNLEQKIPYSKISIVILILLLIVASLGWLASSKEKSLLKKEISSLSSQLNLMKSNTPVVVENNKSPVQKKVVKKKLISPTENVKALVKEDDKIELVDSVPKTGSSTESISKLSKASVHGIRLIVGQFKTTYFLNENLKILKENNLSPIVRQLPNGLSLIYLDISSSLTPEEAVVELKRLKSLKLVPNDAFIKYE